jgi:hypothetical protein
MFINYQEREWVGLTFVLCIFTSVVCPDVLSHVHTELTAGAAVNCTLVNFNVMKVTRTWE